MNRRAVEEYLAKWYKRKLPPLIEREMNIEPIKNKAISIVGPRRSGKTYYFFQLIGENMKDSLYLDFEDVALLDIRYTEIKSIIDMFIELTGEKPKRLFFDEIQNIDRWESAVRSLLDEYRIFITGSSSKLLSKEIATSLRGRSVSYVLLPFSFREFLAAKNFEIETPLTSEEKAKVRKYLREYLEFGGFPEVVLNDKKDEKDVILKEYFETIFFKDMVERHRMKSIDLARFIFSFIVQNFSKEMSVNKIINHLKSQGKRFGKDTVYDYLDKIQDSMAFFFVRRYSESAYLRESWPKKVYISDTGLCRTMRFSTDTGKLMENAVFLELLRKRNRKPLLEIFYWKGQGQREVDFALKEGVKITQLIQVSCSSDIAEISKREISSLLEASRKLRCENLKIITWDFENIAEIKGRRIEFIPLWKWLL